LLKTSGFFKKTKKTGLFGLNQINHGFFGLIGFFGFNVISNFFLSSFAIFLYKNDPGRLINQFLVLNYYYIAVKMIFFM
jgi:hypothetical protein